MEVPVITVVFCSSPRLTDVAYVEPHPATGFVCTFVYVACSKFSAASSSVSGSRATLCALYCTVSSRHRREIALNPWSGKIKVSFRTGHARRSRRALSHGGTNKFGGCVSDLLFPSGVSERALDCHATFVLQVGHFVLLIEVSRNQASPCVVETFRFSVVHLVSSEATPVPLFLSNFASEGDENLENEPDFFATLHGQRMSLSPFGGCSSRTRLCAFQICFTPFRVAEDYTVLRLRRLLQTGAAIGWLQGISSRSEEGRASCPGRKGNSSRSSEGRVVGPRNG